MKKLPTILLVLLAVLSLVIAVVYFTHTAENLPHYFLGYTQGLTKKHTKHGLVFVALAVVFLIGAWMLSGKSEEDTPQDNTASNDSQQD